MVFSADDLCRSLVEVATQRSGRFATVYDTCDRVLGAGVACRFSQRLLPAYEAVTEMLEVRAAAAAGPAARGSLEKLRLGNPGSSRWVYPQDEPGMFFFRLEFRAPVRTGPLKFRLGNPGSSRINSQDESEMFF